MSKLKREGDSLIISTAEQEPKILSIRDLLGLLPFINIVLAIVFILLIPNFYIDVVLLSCSYLPLLFFLV